MKKNILYILAACFAFLPLVGADIKEHTNLAQRDFPPLYDFINSKRSIPWADKRKSLRFTGDIRADWLWRQEKEDDLFLRGGSAHDRDGVPIPADQMEAKLNIFTDYKCNDFWGFSAIEFTNLFGIERLKTNCKSNDPGASPQLLFGSGFCDYLCLKRMYLGGTIWKREEMKLDFEVGRKSLYYTFDSRIQYKARVDAIYLRFSDLIAKYEEGRSSDWFIKGAVFLIDQISNYYGWISSTGIYNVCDTGFDWKYSFINWRNKKANRCGVKDPLGWRYTISQIAGDYNFKQRFWGKKLNFYGAFLLNHAASRVSFALTEDGDGNVETLNPDKENTGWYLGFIIGEVRKRGDISIDFNYQYVEAQAVPDCDVRGIGRGNFKKESFTGTRRGNSNFKGVHLEFLYAITDGLSIDVKFEFSRPVDKKIGQIIFPVRGRGNHRYDKFEVELIQRF